MEAYDDGWHYKHRHTGDHGPVEIFELKSIYQENNGVTDESLVWHELLGEDWIAIKDCPDEIQEMLGVSRSPVKRQKTKSQTKRQKTKSPSKGRDDPMKKTQNLTQEEEWALKLAEDAEREKAEEAERRSRNDPSHCKVRSEVRQNRGEQCWCVNTKADSRRFNSDGLCLDCAHQKKQHPEKKKEKKEKKKEKKEKKKEKKEKKKKKRKNCGGKGKGSSRGTRRTEETDGRGCKERRTSQASS
jgi:hypothetical protein